MITEYTKKGSKLGITVKEVSSKSSIVDYINNKNGNKTRADDKISNFYYVGHATPGDLEIGYDGTGEHFDLRDLKSSSFKSGARVDVVAACRIAISGFFEDSIVEQFQEILDDKSDIYGSNVKTQYDGGVRTDANFYQRKKGK